MKKFFQLVVIVAFAVGFVIFYLDNRPSWELSARNSDEGVIVEVYLTDQPVPTYTTILLDRKITTEVNRINRLDLPSDVGSTTFHDETLRPGRWTVEIAGEKIDIMQRALILEDGTEIRPSGD